MSSGDMRLRIYISPDDYEVLLGPNRTIKQIIRFENGSPRNLSYIKVDNLDPITRNEFLTRLHDLASRGNQKRRT